jgi:hypothetical protein
MVCERCGSEMPINAAICPTCGTASSIAKAKQPSTGYGQHSSDAFGSAKPYQPDYAQPSLYAQSLPPPPQPHAQAAQQPGYAPPSTQQFGYGPSSTPHNASNTYSPGIVNPYMKRATFSNKNDGALVAEIILSLFGLFGIGWLLAGETTVGIVLLICSIVIYWPVMILGTIFTFGIGLLCLGPIAIAAIIANIILLNNILNRKAAKFVVTPTQPGP